MTSIIKDVEGETICTGCERPVRTPWMTVKDFPVEEVRVVAFACEACEGVRVEARSFRCQHSGPFRRLGLALVRWLKKMEAA